MEAIETVLENIETMLLDDNIVEAYEYACDYDLCIRKHPRGYAIVGLGVNVTVEL